MEAISTQTRPSSGRASDACGALAHGVITPPLASEDRVGGTLGAVGLVGRDEGHRGACATEQGWEP